MPTPVPWPAALDYAVEDPWREQPDRDGPTYSRLGLNPALDQKPGIEELHSTLHLQDKKLIKGKESLPDSLSKDNQMAIPYTITFEVSFSQLIEAAGSKGRTQLSIGNRTSNRQTNRTC
ncbi:hypothetical protein CDAR_387161 [Caerostris darwini]|uniref:Uncharacterized protein n=1 Tax=Caerostris darwini TaxID=1538125 RepID=A0AAV4MYA0_9ARAC|nr:hypothetical protein CDAR_387161 [Caerostris darwini]